MTARKRLGTQTLASAIRQLTRFRALGIAALGAPGIVLAGPTGEDVVHGDVGITRPNPGGTVVDQGSSNAIVNWDSFSVGSDEYVNFIQPSSSAVILNRVIGNNASEILGTIDANGHVFLVNPNGVYFGPGASLDLQGFLATTLDIDNADFIDGNYTFTKPADAPADASVVNDGVITAKDGGYVVLAGDYVENNGVVAAKAGHVALGAGRQVTLDIEGDGLVNFAVDEKSLSSHAGVKNAGDLIADGGTVVMTAKVAEDLVTTAVNNEGLVQARSISESGGEVYLAGEGGNIEHSGTVDAAGTGDHAGGTVRVESNKNIHLSPGATVNVGGAGSGHGGEARAIAGNDLHIDSGAEILAAGGSRTTGGGGFIEVSGHGGGVWLNGKADVGTGGTILFDPASVTLVSGSTAIGGSQVGISWIEGELNNNNSVQVQATSTIDASSGAGNLVATGGSGNLSFFAQSSSAGGSLSIDLTNISLIDINGGITLNANQPFTFSTAVEPGTSIQLGDVSAASVTIYGHSITTGTLTANTGAITIGGHTDATGSLLAASTIQTGNVDAAGNVRVLADTSINLGNVTGNAANIVLSNFSTSNGTFTLDVGDVTATGTGTNDNVLISAAAAPASSLGGNNNVRVTTGAISAAGGNITARASALGDSASPGSASLSIGGPVSGPRLVHFDARANGTGTGSITINDKTTSGQRIRVATDGGNIVAGTLSVNNAGGTASIDVVAADLTNGIGGDITINGAVNASGQARSGALGSFGDANLGPADQPLAARVRIETLQSGSNAINISNGINVTANAASNYSLAGTNFDTNTRDEQNGSGGVATVSVGGGTNGTVALGGLTMTGPDVFADIHGGSVSLGAVSMTGTGHSVSRRQEDLSLGTEIFSSTNTAGFANLFVDNYGSGARITAGDIAIAGQGIVRASLVADRLSAGNVSIDASAANFNRSGIPRGVAQATTSEQRQLAFGYVPLFDEMLGDPTFDEPDFDEGTVTAGSARLNVSGGFDPQAGEQVQATSASFGSITMSGAGNVEGRVNAIDITVGGNVSITAAAGNISGGIGTRIFQDTTGNTYDVSDQMDGEFGAARLDLIGGSTGSVNLAGTVNLEGPGATADFNGGTVQFGDTVTLNGTGGTIVVRSDYTNIDNSADTYTTRFEGPFERTGMLAFANTVDLASGLTISGVGFAGALIRGNAVNTGNIDITATSTAVTRFDSRVMASPETADEGAAVLGLDGADVNGDVTVDAAVDAHIGINGSITGLLNVGAGRNIDTTLPPRLADDGPGGGTLTLPPMNTQATGIAYDADNNIDLSGVSLAADWMMFEAGGSILNGGAAGTISADALAMAAAGDIILDATTLDIGTATLGDFGVTTGTGSLIESGGDTDLLAALANNGIAPDHVAPNASFVAGGQVVLSQLSLQGSHLYFKANSISFLNNWNLANSDTLVQITPFNPNANSFFEATRAQLPAHNNGLQLSAEFDLTDIGTLALGDSTDYAGDVFIGQNGDIDLGSTNLVVATTGKVSGLDNVVSSGLVDELSALAQSGFQELSIEEIEGESGTEDEDEDEEEGDLGTGGEGGDDDQLISHDTIDESNICT